MPKPRAVVVALGVAFLFALAASVTRADALHYDSLAGSVKALDNMSLHLPDVSRAEEHAALFSDFQSNNGKHLGLTLSAVHPGPKLGIVRGPAPAVTQNPEPATMLLFGTGLAAVGAGIRRRRRVR